MFVGNLQIGFPSANDVFFTNSRLNFSSISGAPVCQKPIFRVVSGHSGARSGSIFCSSKLKVGYINASPDGEAETYSTTSGLLEKEFKFSPTFVEYVKILESVKTDRRRIASEEGDFHGPKKKSLGSSKAETVGQKSKSKDAIRNSQNAKSDVIEKSGSAWAMVEGILEENAKQKSGQGRRVRPERIAGDMNGVKSAREVLYKQSNHGKISIHGRTFEKKRMSQRTSEKPTDMSLRSMTLDKSETRNAVNNEMGHSDSVKPQFTPYQDIKNLNYQNFGLHKKIHGVAEVIDDELLRNKRTWKRGVKETEEYRKVFSGLNEVKSNNHRRTERDYSGNEKSNHLKRFSYGRSRDGSMVVKSEGHNFAKSAGKYESSSTFDNMNATGKLRRSKMVDSNMEGNQHNQSINAQDSDLYTSGDEIYHKGGNRRNARFHDTVGAESINSRALICTGRSSETPVAYHDVSEGEREGAALEDRAAFKTFEVFTDVSNRPRFLRMEMEERIRNLAKWLNASNLNMPEWQFSKMIHSSKIKFTEHSILRVIQILGSFGNWRQVLQIIEWFHSRERFKYYKSRYIYTTALDVLGKAKRPMEALNIFYAMLKQLSSYPDLAAYHCIAVTLGQAGLMKELFDVIDCMRAAPVKKFDLGPLQKWDPRLNPDIVVYNSVLNACVHEKQWEGAFWVLQELKEHGIRPSNTTYGLIMEVMLECGKYNLVYEFFWKLQKNSIPGALNYKVLVNTLWREGKVEEAVEAVKDMERRGIVGCAGLYYDIARCLCSSGRCEEALHQINKICKVAKKPLVVTYTGLIQECLNSGSIENAAYIFSQMKSVCSPNIITCNIMLKSYVEHGMFNEAKYFFEKILSDSHQNNIKDQSNSKVFPDKFTFNTMMEACVAASKWDDFENFYREMLHHGYHFNERRHMRLVFDAWRAGKKNILEITWNHLTGNGRAPPPAIIKELFCMKMNENESTAAVSFIAVHRDMEMEAFSGKSWRKLLETGIRHISGQLLHDLMRNIGQIAQPHPVHLNLLTACKELCSKFRW
ncbi:Pentatricopeptide repeat-containing protein [Platanthera guangdongensis]|uniref:Pentatricopeptide repeat-containing protein n=1 Tax=Platanthera guangdongensis TaxID=2320717 RepID=A0ABR2LIZ8_9ASPA